MPIYMWSTISHGYMAIMFGSSKKQNSNKTERNGLDPISGLPDRSSFLGMLGEFLNDRPVPQSMAEYFGLSNIEHFKLINHSYGREAGDHVLQEVARRMRIELGDEVLLGRLGNDEFGFVARNKSLQQIRDACGAVSQSFQDTPLPWYDRRMWVKIQFAVVEVEHDVQDIDQLLLSADKAMFSAQYDKCATVYEYDKNDTAIMRRSGNLQYAITVDRWIARNRFLLFVQPIVGLQDQSKENHYEVLLRGKTDAGKVITPEKLVHAAEQFNLAVKLDKWVIRSLFGWINANRSSLPAQSSFSVNLSALSINDVELSDYIVRLMKKENIDPQSICFEITERIAINNLKHCFEFMARLKRLGFCFSLDDFGTGYGSLKYIKLLPFDWIKIDGSFVHQIEKDPTNYAIVKAISEIAQAFNRKTVAECIENEQEQDVVRQLGIHYGQGYFYSKPQQIEAIIGQTAVIKRT